MPQTNQNKVGILFPNATSPIYDSLWPAGNRGVGSNSWRIASPYRLEVVRPMTAVYPRSSAGTHAAHKWATTKDDYNVRLCWRGGEPPFRLQMTTSPTGAYIGTSGTEQTFTRTVDGTYPTLYKHTLPSKYAQVTLPAANITDGGTYNFTVIVTDQTDAQITFTWSVTAQDSKFKWFDAISGNNANSGTFENPYQTFAYGYTLSNAHTYIYRFKAGTYTVSNNAGGNYAELDDSHCKSYIGYGSGVIFDCSSACFGTGTTDLTIQNARIQGGPSFTNVRQIQMSNPTTNLHLRNLTFDTELGTTGGDNPAGLMTYAQDSPTYHDYLSLVDCALVNTSAAAMAVLFSVRYWLIENTIADIDAMSGGALIVNAKHGTHTGTMRFNNWEGRTDNGILWVSSQNPNECLDVEFIYNRINSDDVSDTYITRWNNQALVGSRPQYYYAQRNSIQSLSGYPYTMENYVSGYNVNYGSTLWNTPKSTITDTTGGTALTTTNVKVADIDTISGTDLGVRGCVIASTLVT